MMKIGDDEDDGDNDDVDDEEDVNVNEDAEDGVDDNKEFVLWWGWKYEGDVENCDSERKFGNTHYIAHPRNSQVQPRSQKQTQVFEVAIILLIKKKLCYNVPL